MAKLSDFVTKTEFGDGAIKVPVGKTLITLDETEVTEAAPFTDDNGKVKPRWKLKTKDASYFVGVAIMGGIKREAAKGAKKVEIIREGTDKNTKYIVLPV